MYKIQNTSTDRSKVFLHRRAARMVMEPTIAGSRLQMGKTMVITDEMFEAIRPQLDALKAQGVIDYMGLGREVEIKSKVEETCELTDPTEVCKVRGEPEQVVILDELMVGPPVVAEPVVEEPVVEVAPPTSSPQVAPLPVPEIKKEAPQAPPPVQSRAPVPQKQENKPVYGYGKKHR